MTEIIILGCGPSTGIPLLTGYWGACNDKQPRNFRTRSSIAFCINNQTWLIDTSPDIRSQFLREKISSIHGILYSHAHFDHIGGIEELKPFFYTTPENAVEKPLCSIYADDATLSTLHRRCTYAFSPCNEMEHKSGVFLKGYCISPNQTVCIEEEPVTFFTQSHGQGESLGFRFSNWAYSTDASDLDAHALSLIKGVDLWIIACLDRYPRANPTHAHLDQVLAWIDYVKPRQSILTHMGSQLDYDELCNTLPQNIRPAYDGMRIMI